MIHPHSTFLQNAIQSGLCDDLLRLPTLQNTLRSSPYSMALISKVLIPTKTKPPYPGVVRCESFRFDQPEQLVAAAHRASTGAGDARLIERERQAAGVCSGRGNPACGCCVNNWASPAPNMAVASRNAAPARCILDGVAVPSCVMPAAAVKASQKITHHRGSEPQRFTSGSAGVAGARRRNAASVSPA